MEQQLVTTTNPHTPRRSRRAVAAVAIIRQRTGALRRLASDAGQGTVEYVGLLLLMATILAGVVAASSSLGGKDAIGKKVVTQVGNSIDKAAGGKR